MVDPLKSISTRATAQSDRAKPGQVLNNAGGWVFDVGADQRLRRFLTLGVDGGTYYVQPRQLARDNAQVVFELAELDPKALVDTIAEISLAGRAPKQVPGLFALAVAASLADEDGRRHALARLPEVARTGTTLFQFVSYAEQFRSWGRGLRRAIGRWYVDKTTDQLAYQTVKYRQRGGWTHRDLLRLSHPSPVSPGQAALFDWICGRTPPGAELPGLVQAYQQVRELGWLGQGDQVAEVLRKTPGLPWEALPDSALGSAEVWRTLLDQGLPQTALLRQLPRLTNLGLGVGETGKLIARQLADPDRLRRARVHPISVMAALRTYASGRGARGRGAWQPTRQLVDALDEAFYAAYGAVTPTGKRIGLALDVSGSMGWASIGGLPLTPREATAAMALVTAATEDDYEIIAFTGGDAGVSPLAISPRQRLDDVLRAVSDLPFGQTDCALPMLWAAKEKRDFDAFVIYTDNETWFGDVHPFQALRRYRELTGIPAKLVVVGTTATSFTIADPSDPGSLDIAGFDAAVPNLIGDFVRGEV
ncbi:MAG: TROVE domain-containing protein [Bifidobacteriaceae bacterium]|jgi:60 kDa SS-A/Ro ribonucleoprotein|nr:TROVE domain-containing protein [Bifidobacteriaceae bacterium]